MKVASLLPIAFFLLVPARFVQSEDRGDVDQQRAKQLVQKALQAEITESAEKRIELLKQAEQSSSKEPSARWQQGHVLVGKEWKSYEEVVARAQKSKQLEQYRELRDKSEPTLASQYELAVYCRKHGLKEQAIAHWSAILELEPDHEEARVALGFTRFGEQWLKPIQAEQQRQNAMEVAEVLRKEAPELKKLASQLNLGQTTRDDAIKYLIDHADVHAIPAWELLLSSAHNEGAAVVVEALATISAPEASLSLARHAVWGADQSVRNTAIKLLKERDSNSYMQAVLSELQGPWLAFRQVISDGSNRLVSRYTLVADGKEKMALRVLDDSFVMRGATTVASTIVSSTVSRTVSEREQLRQLVNAQQSRHNEAVMSALKALTGENEQETPQDWWQWWDNKNEVYATGLKPIDASYAVRQREVVGNLPLSTSGSTSSRRDRESESRKKDCLAGGTPVLTQRGPINIERIRMGDMVLAKHPITGEVGLQPVLRTTIRDPEMLIRIQFESHGSSGVEGAVIRSSGGHPFWVSGLGWQRARLLEPGMRLHGLSGFATVKSVQIEERASITYNLVVADFHSYFAGSQGLLTHDNSIVAPVRCKVPGLGPTPIAHKP